MGTETYKGPEQNYNNHELEYHGKEALDRLLHEKASEAKKTTPEELDEVRQEAQAEALPAATIQEQQQHGEAEPDTMATLVNKDLKDTKYKRTLQSVRKDLNAPERALSKVVHNPIVDALSAGAEKTIARPSGLLAGSICAFIGSSTFLYIAKHYGYTYNFLLMTMFFVGGFGIGLIAELVSRTVKHSR